MQSDREKSRVRVISGSGKSCSGQPEPFGSGQVKLGPQTAQKQGRKCPRLLPDPIQNAKRLQQRVRLSPVYLLCNIKRRPGISSDWEMGVRLRPKFRNVARASLGWSYCGRIGSCGSFSGSWQLCRWGGTRCGSLSNFFWEGAEKKLKKPVGESKKCSTGVSFQRLECKRKRWSSCEQPRTICRRIEIRRNVQKSQRRMCRKDSP